MRFLKPFLPKRKKIIIGKQLMIVLKPSIEKFPKLAFVYRFIRDNR